MPPRKKREPSMLMNEKCVLGWMFVEERKRYVESFEEKIEEGYVWIQEVLVEIKKSLCTEEVALCPKTPSKKKRKGRQRKRDSAVDDSTSQRNGRSKKSEDGRGKDSGVSQDLDSSLLSTDSQEDADSARPTRSTRATRAASAATKKTGNRSNRKGKQKAEESDTNGPEPAFSLTKSVANKEDSKAVSFKTDEIVNKTGDAKSTPKSTQEQIASQTESDSTHEESPIKRLKQVTKSNSSTPNSEVEIKSPITAIKTAIRARTPVGKTANSSPRAQSPRSQSPRFRGQAAREDSPRKSRTIPNYSILNVKQKASAFEQHFKQDSHSASDDNQTHPQNTTPIAHAKRKTRSADKESVVSNSSRRSSTSYRRSSRRSSKRVSGMRSSLRMSMSRKRSSIMRHQSMSKQAKQKLNQSLKSSPDKSPPLEEEALCRTVIAHLLPNTKACVKPRKGYRGKPGAPAASRSTRSKLRLPRAPPTLPPAESSSDDSEKQPVRTRTTRSSGRKMSEQPPQSTDEMDTDEVDGSATPVTCTLPTPPSSEESVKPKRGSDQAVGSAPRSTRAAMRRFVEQARDSPTEFTRERTSSVKRPKPETTESDEQTPPKRRLVDSEGDSDDELVEGTPEKRSGPRIMKPVRGGLLGSSCKKPASNLNCSVKSFIQRNTPQKKTLRELEEERRRQFESKNKEAERRLAKREEMQQRKRQELKRQREERQKRVASRREQQEKSEHELKQTLVQKLGAGSKSKRLLEDRVREEKEKRDKKMAENEIRRKQGEEQRLQKFKEQEEEKKRLEEQQARRRAEEERERARRLAEQARLDEERRLAQEREREREAARKKQQEEEVRRREEAERREREEREKRERAEREKLELQRQQERERLKREEIEKKKELELKRLREERAKEQERTREERELASMIKKHNHALQSNSSLNTSGNTSNSSKLYQQTQQQAAAKAKLNSSYTVSKDSSKLAVLQQQHQRTQSQDSTDSYDMTPVRKKPKKSANEEDYGINDIKSDDSTDEEDAPKKHIPNWAVGAQLKASLIHQYYQPPDLDDIFDTVIPPDLNVMFIKKRPRFNKRTSSAVWDSPILKPSGAYPT